MFFNPADPVFWVMIAFFAFIGLLVYYRVPGMITQFCPMLHRAPITAPGITWQKCQIFVPAPTTAPSSTNDDGCTKPSLTWPRRAL